MALYTPPPSFGPTNSSLPTLLPHELVQACNFSTLRFPQKLPETVVPLTPPVSTRRTLLPSIKHLDMTPLQPEFEDDDMSEDDDVESPRRSPDPILSDWFSSPHCRTQQSSFHIAEKTCEMVCYLWFSTNSSSSPRRRHQPYFVPQTTSSTASLQFCVSSNFVQFMQKVLETTQVSQSVIVLSLHYIYRLKERNRLTNGESGSEFRVAVAALMMANKFVDDNTYTNKTWSDVSGIPLTEINKMEREILLGIDFSLYVDKATYESWLNLLKGLVMAKEKDGMQWKRSSSGLPRSGRLPRCSVSSHAWSSSNRSASVYSTPSRASGGHRARSTSPPMQSFRYPFTFTAPTSSYTPTQSSHTPTKSGGKRSAADAFSPTSASFPSVKPPKRQMGVPALSLSIPSTHSMKNDSSPNAPRIGKSGSPLDGLDLHHFSKLTLANSPAIPPGTENEEPIWVSSQRQYVHPKTLSAPWALQDRGRAWVAPQNLYYYSLACSPASGDNQQVLRSHRQDSMSVAKKAKLRYHPAPQASTPPVSNPTSYRGPTVFGNRASNHVPMVVHSASTSPNTREIWLECRQPSRSHLPVPSYETYHHSSPARLSVASSGSTPSSNSVSTPSSTVASEDIQMEVPTLPPFNELVLGADGVTPAIYSAAYPYGTQSYDTSPLIDAQPRSRFLSAPTSDNYDSLNGPQAAPFANAGPPGVHHYGYACNGHSGSWEFQPYQSTYGDGYVHGTMSQHTTTAGWVRTR